MVRLLLKHHAKAALTNNQLYTPIHNAAANGHAIIAKKLMDHEKCMNPRFEAEAIIRRVQVAAELHGHFETAAAIAELSHSFSPSPS